MVRTCLGNLRSKIAEVFFYLFVWFGFFVLLSVCFQLTLVSPELSPAVSGDCSFVSQPP